MPIPPLNELGHLPTGEHLCTITEIDHHFGRFQGSERRTELTKKLKQYLDDLTDANTIAALSNIPKVVDHIIVNGSYTTSKDEPGDIDLVIALSKLFNLNGDLPPAVSNPISGDRVRRRYGFDIKVGQVDSDPYRRALQFFSGVKGNPDAQKGLLKVVL